MEKKGSKGHLSTSLAAGTIRPDSLVAAADAERERIHFVNSEEKLTKSVLEAAAAAVVAGNLSNFDSLEF